MEDYVIVDDVPIFDEDELNPTEKLMRICEVNNNRIMDTGDKIPLVIGHTTEGATEKEQPEIVGWASNLKLGTIGNLNPRSVITATWEILKDCADEVKKYPRRSIELWLDDYIIDPIALLGASRPAKNLGLLTFSAEKQSKITKYFEDKEEIEMDKTDIINLITEIMNQSELAAAVKKIMEDHARLEHQEQAEEQPEADQEGVETEQDAEEAAETPEEEASETEEVAQEAEEHPELSDETVEQIVEDHEVAKEEATPGAGNTFVPAIEGDEDEKKKKKNELQGEVVKYQAEVNQYKIDLETKNAIVEKYAAELKKVADERNDLVNKYKMAVREKDLVVLSHQYSFDKDVELKEVESMDDAQYDQHINIIKTRYNKVPLDRGFVSPIQTEQIGGKERLSQEQILAIVRYAGQHKMEFEAAKRELYK